MTSGVPITGRPNGCVPKMARPRRSKTRSWGSSSYIAISSRTTSLSVSSSPKRGRHTMSVITSKARSRCRSSTLVYSEVDSLSVPAFISAPMASKIWSISSDPNRSLPRKSMCSSRWEIPASSSRSTTEPVAIQKPSATERTAGTGSVTTLTPDSSSVIRCPAPSGLRPRSVPVTRVARPPRAARRATGALAPPATVGSTAAAAIAQGARRTPPARWAGSGPNARELVDGLAGDVRVVGQAQADPAPLAVDLDHAHVDLVALVEDVLHALHALAGRHVRYVQQPVGALGELHESTERRGLDHFAHVLVADLDLLHHHADPLDERVSELAV